MKNQSITVQQLVEEEAFLTVIRNLVLEQEKKRSGRGPFKRSVYDVFIADKVKGDFPSKKTLDSRYMEIAQTIRVNYLQVLDKTSKLPSSQRRWIKTFGDFCLRVFLEEIKKKQDERKITENIS